GRRRQPGTTHHIEASKDRAEATLRRSICETAVVGRRKAAFGDTVADLDAQLAIKRLQGRYDLGIVQPQRVVAPKRVCHVHGEHVVGQNVRPGRYGAHFVACRHTLIQSLQPGESEPTALSGPIYDQKPEAQLIEPERGTIFPSWCGKDARGDSRPPELWGPLSLCRRSSRRLGRAEPSPRPSRGHSRVRRDPLDQRRYSRPQDQGQPWFRASGVFG